MVTAQGKGNFWVYVEGGGSQTWMACATSQRIGTRRVGSTSLRSTTAGESKVALTLLARDACHTAGVDPMHCRAVIAAHGAASTQRTCEAFFTLLKSALGEAGIGCPLLLTNDLVPLLLGAAEEQPLVAVVAGTGTGFGARSAVGSWARASGCEYLLSDEGGGFDIGMSGLRAAIRAVDGRGAPTALVGLARKWCGAESDNIVDRLCEKVYVPGFKPVVASFARCVLEAAAHDEVANVIIAAAACELAAGVRAVARSAGCSAPDTRVLLSGSLLTKHEILASALHHELGNRIGQACFGVIPEGWLLAGFDRLRENWVSDGSTLRRLASAFPVRADAP